MCGSCNCRVTVTYRIYTYIMYTTSEEGSATKSEVGINLDARLIHSFMDIVILKLLKNDHLVSGYDLIRHFHQRFHTQVSSGTLYSMLYSLERQGLIQGNYDGRRRVYKLTEHGEEFLKRIWMAHQHSYAVFSSIFSSPEVE